MTISREHDWKGQITNAENLHEPEPVFEAIVHNVRGALDIIIAVVIGVDVMFWLSIHFRDRYIQTRVHIVYASCMYIVQMYARKWSSFQFSTCVRSVADIMKVAVRIREFVLTMA